jgi:hypothetical protein
MNQKYIALLTKRIEKLEEKDFDLEAWKSATVSTMEGFMKESDPRIKKINELKIDYSSWALRDATSKYNPEETCKKKGKEILQAIIDELEIESEMQGEAVSILEILEKHLDKKTIQSLDETEDTETVLSILKREKKESLAKALSEILSVQ